MENTFKISSSINIDFIEQKFIPDSKINNKGELVIRPDADSVYITDFEKPIHSNELNDKINKLPEWYIYIYYCFIYIFI